MNDFNKKFGVARMGKKVTQTEIFFKPLVHTGIVLCDNINYKINILPKCTFSIILLGLFQSPNTFWIYKDILQFGSIHKPFVDAPLANRHSCTMDRIHTYYSCAMLPHILRHYVVYHSVPM